MTRERHLLGHLIFQTNEGDVAVASKQSNLIIFIKLVEVFVATCTLLKQIYN